MNQLQNLLQDSLIATGNVDHCAIVRRKDVSLRASSSGFMLSISDMEDLIEAFRHPVQTRDDGISLHGIKYKCVRADKFSIYAKKKESHFPPDPIWLQKNAPRTLDLKMLIDDAGLVLVKTATLILIGTYNREMYPSICVEAVEKLGSIDFISAKYTRPVFKEAPAEKQADNIEAFCLQCGCG